MCQTDQQLMFFDWFQTCFSPTAYANGVFSPDKLRCVSARIAGAGSGGRFRKVPESSSVCWCGSGGRFRKVPESSGVCCCRFRRQVPEGSGVTVWQVPEGSGEFRCGVPVCAIVGSGGKFRKVPELRCGRFRKVPESSGVLGSGIPESSGEFRCVLVYVAGASSGRFWRVPESSGVRWCGYRSQGSEGYGELRCGLLPCNLVRGSHVIVLNTFW